MDYEEGEMKALERIMSDAKAEPMKLSVGLMRSITNNFSNEIGRGGFGVVYRGVLQNGDVAVKKLLINPRSLSEKEFLDEVTCLKRAKHENIVKFLGYCSETQGECVEFNGANVMGEAHQKLLCFEYVPNGNIKHYLQKEKSHGNNWPLRYRMIRGICRGLHYLHGENINHLDLKPENIMLDAQMEPKITDFGLSRCLDQGQSKIFTQNIRGTLRYIAPETIDDKEISFKSDMYALGIIIIELLTGTDLIGLDNWDEKLDMDCPRVRGCTEIARNCTDRHKDNRPTIADVIRDLDKLESMVPRSSIKTVTKSVFPTNNLLDVYPLELRFPFVPNKRVQCHLTVTNKTDNRVYYAIIPEDPDRYKGGFCGNLPPRNTRAITLHREAEEELPSYTEKLEMIMLPRPSDTKEHEKIKNLHEGTEKSSYFRIMKEAHELGGLPLHRTMLTTTMVYVSTDDDRVPVADITGHEVETTFSYMDVHPIEPWVLLVGRTAGTVYIWNWKTSERIGEYVSSVTKQGEVVADTLVAEFISREQWVVAGREDGSILVRTCPKMDPVKEFQAHFDGVSSLVVHPTRPFLLSCSKSFSLKMWDWFHGWSCTGMFDIARRLRHVMFSPNHTSNFATLDMDGIVEMWRIGDPHPIARAHNPAFGMDGSFSSEFSYIGRGHFIASIFRDTICVWDLQKEQLVHTLHVNIPRRSIAMNLQIWFRLVVCHPTLALFITVSADKSIHVWDSTTYRLKKVYENLPMIPSFARFNGPTRLVIGDFKKISVMDIDVE